MGSSGGAAPDREKARHMPPWPRLRPVQPVEGSLPAE